MTRATYVIIALLLGSAIMGVVAFLSRPRSPCCRRCGDRVSPQDAREFCVFPRCPHRSRMTLGDIT